MTNTGITYETYHKVPWLISSLFTPFYSADKIPTTSPIQPKEEPKALQSEYENKDTSAVTVEHDLMTQDQPLKCEG